MLIVDYFLLSHQLPVLGYVKPRNHMDLDRNNGKVITNARRPHYSFTYSFYFFAQFSK